LGILKADAAIPATAAAALPVVSGINHELACGVRAAVPVPISIQVPRVGERLLLPLQPCGSQSGLAGEFGSFGFLALDDGFA